MPFVQRDANGVVCGRFANPQPGLAEEWLQPDDAELQPAADKVAASLCSLVDASADAARRAVAGDPLRAVEYDRAASEAQAFAAAGYQGAVPPMVAAWAISGRTPQQAADSILAEAAQYNYALVQLRTVRLQAKELIRAAMAGGNIEQAQDIAAETIASIEAAVAGIGNNAS
ncbi:phage tail protein [Pseudomonas mosselii]|uniref:phage tail protein n=1 Tax=Pseudomonas mosselii TaxID=78327 RepID=UPI003F1DB197